MRAVRSGLSSLRLQLVEPGLDSTLKKNTINSLVPVLIRILEIALEQSSGVKKSDGLVLAYGGAIETANTMLQRFVGDQESTKINIRESWESGDTQPLSDAIAFWQGQVSSK